MNALTVYVTIETRKGEQTLTRWSVQQDRPYPDTERGRWRNGAGVLPDFNGPARGLDPIYRCCLLASDCTGSVEEGHGSTACAGYEDRPGTITYRGRDLGEMSVDIDRRRPEAPYAHWKVRGFAGATAGERAFLDAQVLPPLSAFIDANRAELWKIAVAGVRLSLAEHVERLRNDADRLEREAAGAMAALEEIGPR